MVVGHHCDGGGGVTHGGTTAMIVLGSVSGGGPTIASHCGSAVNITMLVVLLLCWQRRHYGGAQPCYRP